VRNIRFESDAAYRLRLSRPLRYGRERQPHGEGWSTTISLFQDGEDPGMPLMMTISNAEYDTNDAILPVERRS
jgi:hypothetical protein